MMLEAHINLHITLPSKAIIHSPVEFSLTDRHTEGDTGLLTPQNTSNIPSIRRIHAIGLTSTVRQSETHSLLSLYFKIKKKTYILKYYNRFDFPKSKRLLI